MISYIVRFTTRIWRCLPHFYRLKSIRKSKLSGLGGRSLKSKLNKYIEVVMNDVNEEKDAIKVMLPYLENNGDQNTKQWSRWAIQQLYHPRLKKKSPSCCSKRSRTETQKKSLSLVETTSHRKAFIYMPSDLYWFVRASYEKNILLRLFLNYS